MIFKKMLPCLVLLFLGVFVLVSCATIPKPESARVGGVAGKFCMIMDSHFDSFSKGKYNSGVKLEFINLADDKKYHTYVHDGYFFLLNLPPGKYKLVDWMIERNDDWMAGEIGQGYGVKTNIERDSYTGVIDVKAKGITVTDNIKVRFNFSQRYSQKHCYFEYEYVYLSEPDQKDIVQQFKKEAEDNYRGWESFQWNMVN
jgi:hypothetical protein